MDNQKLENLLNLSLDATPTELEKSLELNSGFNETTKSWTLIIKYVNSIVPVEALSLSVVELFGNYAIIEIREDRILALSQLPEVIYIEKPKPLYFAVMNARRVSCVDSVQTEPLNLYGRGCIVGIIDSGIDYKNEVFLDALGNSRIYSIWDQTIPGNPPASYRTGSYFDQASINASIRTNIPLGTTDFSGHGTAVASIAAGNFSPDKTRNQGMATQCDIIAVKLGQPSPDSFPKTSELMQAIDFVVREALSLNKPLALNLSFGNNYGSHVPYDMGKHYFF